jgi:hypothetical protein
MAPRLRSTAPAALLAAALLAGTAAQSRAAVAFEATVEPGEISFLETRELSYRLRMTTGGREERFDVRVEQAGWDPLPGRGPPGFAIVPDCFRQPLVLEGPGSLADTVCVPRPVRDGVCGRGGGLWELRAELTLPAHSSSTLVARFLTAGPPLRRTDYRATFAVGGGQGDTLAGDQEIRPSAPAVLPPFGTHVTLATRPSTPYFFRFPALRRFRRGRAIHIRGRTERSLRGQTIALRYQHTPPGRRTRQRTLARVQIDDRGRFGYRGWRPRGRGLYRLSAVHLPESSSRVSQESCARGFTVRG